MSGPHNGASHFRKPYDEYFTFLLQDFQSGDCIIAHNRGERLRGIVKYVDSRTMQIVYTTKDRDIQRSYIDDIIMLQSNQKGWLK